MGKLKDQLAGIAALIAAVVAIDGDVDNSLTELDKRSAINQKQIQLLQVQIEELKASSSNPLAN